MLTNGRTHGRTDDGQKVITIAHPEHISGELKTSKRAGLGVASVVLVPDLDLKKKSANKAIR